MNHIYYLSMDWKERKEKTGKNRYCSYDLTESHKYFIVWLVQPLLFSNFHTAGPATGDWHARTDGLIYVYMCNTSAFQYFAARMSIFNERAVCCLCLAIPWWMMMELVVAKSIFFWYMSLKRGVNTWHVLGACSFTSNICVEYYCDPVIVRMNITAHRNWHVYAVHVRRSGLLMLAKLDNFILRIPAAMDQFLPQYQRQMS